MKKTIIILVAVIAIIILAITAFIFYANHQISSIAKEQLQQIPLVQEKVGSIKKLDINISDYSAHCSGDDCAQIERFVFIISGDKGLMKVAADVDVGNRHLNHMNFCDANGDLLMQSEDNKAQALNGQYCQ
ncbi:hypothetical protein [Neisseria sp. Ec49-e6-T10]|uniref:hypothetical protein n=1 Tax=Neisseria sp. Ec49-e6-T10 TaxID=3140744 RepID=UPI003EC0CBF4